MQNMKRRGFLLASVLVLLLVAAACGETEPSAGEGDGDGATQAEAPRRAVEFVVTTSPGGGSDQYARFISNLIEQQDLSPVPFVVVNQPGGAGAVGMQYLHSKVGDGNAILITLNSVFTTPQLQELPFASIAEDFTPIASMALDPFVLWTSADSWETYEEFEAEAKERQLTAAGTGAQQEDEVLLNLLVRAAGLQEMRYVPQEGGGDVAAQVAGGHVDVSVNQPSEALPHYPDRMRPLMTFTQERLEDFPDVPTFEEVGLEGNPELDYIMIRGIVGAPGMPEANQLWFQDIFRQVFESEEWQEFLEQNQMLGDFSEGDEFGDLLTQYVDLHTDLIEELGWAPEG